MPTNQILQVLNDMPNTRSQTRSLWVQDDFTPSVYCGVSRDALDRLTPFMTEDIVTTPFVPKSMFVPPLQRSAILHSVGTKMFVSSGDPRCV